MEREVISVPDAVPAVDLHPLTDLIPVWPSSRGNMSTA